MSNWQLHEFTIAPGARDRFLNVWRSRLLPLANRHGPYVGGCWTEKGADKFIWLVSNDLHRVDDALAEDWPAMLVRQERIGTMDVSVPLVGLEAGQCEAGLADQSRLEHNQYYRLDVDTVPSGSSEPFDAVLEHQVLPALRANNIDVVGAWRNHAGSRYYHLTGFKDEEDFTAKKSALTDTPGWGEIDSAVRALHVDRAIRELEICRF